MSLDLVLSGFWSCVTYAPWEPFLCFLVLYMYRLPYCQGNKILCTSIMALLRELFTLHQALGNLVSVRCLVCQSWRED